MANDTRASKNGSGPKHRARAKGKPLDYVASFIGKIRDDLVPGPPGDGRGAWFSRHDKGSLFLNDVELRAYADVLERLRQDYVKHGDLSDRSLESYLQDAVFHALDILGRSATTFDERVREAVEELKTTLSAPPLTYRCFVPVEGFALKDLPLAFGPLRFVVFGKTHRRLLAENTGKRGNPFRRSVADLVGEPFAVVPVEARDFETASRLARERARAAFDTINFLFDIIPYNHGWLRLPGEAASTRASAAVVRSDGKRSVSGSVVGPIGPFSLNNLRKHALPRNLLLALAALSKHADAKTAGHVLLASVRWAGRASVEPKREQAFLLFAIALEATVIPKQDLELSERLALRVARLLGTSSRSRRETKQLTKKLYGIRSKIVHSGSYEVTDENLGRLRSLALTVLVRLLKRRKLWGMSPDQLEDWWEGVVSR